MHPGCNCVVLPLRPVALDESDFRRDELTTYLRQAGPPPQVAEGSLLTGWAIIMSWVEPDGTQTLSRGHAAELPSWMAKGLYHEALYGDWNAEDE